MHAVTPAIKWLYLKGMADNPSGWIILCNLLDGLDQNLFCKEFAGGLILCWMREYARRKKADKKAMQTGQPLLKPRSNEELLRDSFDAVCSAPRDDVACPEVPPQGFRLHCRRMPSSKSPLENYSSIADARDFVDERMHSAEKTRLDGELWLKGVLGASHVAWDSWRPAGKISIRLDPLGPGGHPATIGNPAKVLWVTPEEGMLESRRRAVPADGLRDMLGLVHLHNCQLLAMTLPKAVVERLDHGRPTVADAGSHRRHMARSSHRADGVTTPWGWTADLARFANGAADIDGLPERVVRPIPVAFLPQVEVQVLGSCGLERGIAGGKDDDGKFARMLCDKHGGTTAMMMRVQELLA